MTALTSLMVSFLSMILVLLWIPVVIMALIIAGMAIRFYGSEYHRQTRNGFFATYLNKGRYGEYLVYKNLRALPQPRRFLFNIYLPAENDETTEADVLLLHPSGIYVFESKNYSGWIFGTEAQRQWTQSLPAGHGTRKLHFFNPILQNAGHIHWLKSALADFGDLPYHSLILFSDRCQLKKITLTSSKAAVIHRGEVYRGITQRASETGSVLTSQQIRQIYDALLPYTQVAEADKLRHVEQIHKKYAPEIQKDLTAGRPMPSTEKFPVLGAIPTAEQAVLSDSRNPLCPRCGKPLVQRVARSGAHVGQKFWGCSGFPNCRYIRQIPSGTDSTDVSSKP
ncbi:NERD domain-containing protein [Ethanoligenens sp.]|uniref:nuclease-related domain-containing protein n=1 Tax=Ethanoligenens sp. TaxID=2099655 RepID=UPI0039E79EA6